MQIYGLKTCDTCRKAIRLLPQAQFVDVRAEGVPDAVLAEAEQRFGAALLNTRSTTWRGLDENEKEKPALALIKAHPALMKRPLIVHNGTYHLGWSADTQQMLLEE